MTVPAPPVRRWRPADLPRWRVAALAIAGLVGVVAVDPQHRHIPLCPFHAATGLDCPLCGGLRAVDALAHLRLGEALRDNLLVVLLVLPLSVCLLVLRPTGRPQPRWLVPVVITVGLAFAIVRNLPFAAGLRPR